MSPSPVARRSVHRHRASDYWKVATHLMESARALVTLGDDAYGNAIGICIIHAMISANDAITILLAGVRSSSNQHSDAQRLLQEIVPKVPDNIARAFGIIIKSKAIYEYSGDILTTADAKKLLAKAETFYTWAQSQLK